MNDSVYDPQVRECRDHDRMLELFAQPALCREALIHTQVRMLESCPIPNVLPLHVAELDMTVTLRYPLEHRIPLSEALRVRDWPVEDRLRCLLEIAGTMDGCGQYLLRANQFSLLPDRVYVGNDPRDVRLLYVPVRSIAGKPDVQREFLELVRCLSAVPPADAAPFNRLGALLNGQAWTFGQIKRELVDVLHAANDWSEPVPGDDGLPERKRPVWAAASVSSVSDREDGGSEAGQSRRPGRKWQPCGNYGQVG